MALTKSVVKKVAHRGVKIVYVDITFDNSYPTTGEPLLPEEIGLKEIFWAGTDCGGKNSAGTLALPVRYDYVNKKLQAYEYNGAAAGLARLQEVANATDLSAFTARLKFEGVA